MTKLIFIILMILPILSYGNGNKLQNHNHNTNQTQNLEIQRLLMANQKFEKDSKEFLDEISRGVKKTKNGEESRGLKDNFNTLFLLSDVAFKTKADIFIIRAAQFKESKNRYEKYSQYISNQDQLTSGFLSTDAPGQAALVNIYLNIAENYNKAVDILYRLGQIETIRHNYPEMLLARTCVMPSFDPNNTKEKEDAEKRYNACLAKIEAIKDLPLHEALEKFKLYQEPSPTPYSGEMIFYLKYREGIIYKFDTRKDIQAIEASLKAHNKPSLMPYLTNRKKSTHDSPSNMRSRLLSKGSNLKQRIVKNVVPTAKKVYHNVRGRLRLNK